jgi:hypothetical protein
MGSGSSPSEIPFNWQYLLPEIPSARGPFNVKGAQQNAQMLQAKFPWVTPSAGSFEGAMPGQYAQAGGGGGSPFGSLGASLGGGILGLGGGMPGVGSGGGGTPSSGGGVGVTSPDAPPPTPAQIAQFGPQSTMQPPVDTSGHGEAVSLQDILAALNPQRTR